MRKLTIEIPKGCIIDKENSDLDKGIIRFLQKEKFNIEIDTSDLMGFYPWMETLKQIELLNSLNYKGHNDWRLPTKDELNYLYENKDIIGGFSSHYYWSSTELGNSRAWYQYFDIGSQFDFDKYTSSRVRCVRDL